MRKIGLFVALALISAPTVLFAHRNSTLITQDSSGLTMDGIRFEATAFTIDSAKNIATVTPTLTCLSPQSRELKINVYGTQLVDDQRNAYYFSTITMGRVLMRFEDRQNYLHYLLQPNIPAKLTITSKGIPSGTTAIQVVKVVFEDKIGKASCRERVGQYV